MYWGDIHRFVHRNKVMNIILYWSTGVSEFGCVPQVVPLHSLWFPPRGPMVLCLPGQRRAIITVCHVVGPCF